MFNFLWDGKPDKIKREIICKDYAEGGLRMVNLEYFINALKISWIRKIILNNKKYMQIINTEIPDFKFMLIVGAECIQKQSKIISNPFWRDVYSAYSLFLGKLVPKTQKEAKSVFLFGNKNLKVGGKPIFNYNFIKNNIYTINDLLKNDGTFLTFTEFIGSYENITNFLEYAGIISSIKAYLTKLTIQDIGKRLEEPLLPLSLSILLKINKDCRDIYDIMIHSDVKPTSVDKWCSETGGEINNILKLFQLPYKCQKDTHLQWFQTRINNRILGTNVLLYKMKIKK